MTSIDHTSGRVTFGGRHVGTIHFPYEETGRQVRRSTYKLLLAGTSRGTFPTFAEAAAVAVAQAAAASAELATLRGTK